MYYGIQAHLVKGSNKVYWYKKNIKNVEEEEIEKVTIYLSPEEIARLYEIANKKVSEEYLLKLEEAMNARKPSPYDNMEYGEYYRHKALRDSELEED